MNYTLQTNTDLVSGTSVTVTIPEDELDMKALYTIEATTPDFVLPFHYRIIDGQVELVYMIGQHSKLQYFSGDRSAKEYSELWFSVLNPLLDCGDWFLRPYCFVVGSEHLYYDKNNNTVSYIYIPARDDCSDYDALREMAIDISSLISVVNADIENKVLRSIMRSFNPRDFLSMLKPYLTSSAPVASRQPLSEAAAANSVCAYTPPAYSPPVYSSGRSREEASASGRFLDSATPQNEIAKSISDDIIINFPMASKSSRKHSEKLSDNDYSDDYSEGYGGKGSGTTKSKTSSKLFGKKKNAQSTQSDDTFQTASNSSAHMIESTASPTSAFAGSFNSSFPSGFAASSSSSGHAASSSPTASASSAFVPSAYSTSAEADDITQISTLEVSGARLRFVGTLQMPSVIDVQIEEGEVFTIGRYDSAIGRSQSSFEFDKTAKGVSRRHAAIERCSGKYTIIDLSSSAGTYVDRKKIPPNTPHELESGSRISFGSTGVNYVWEA